MLFLTPGLAGTAPPFQVTQHKLGNREEDDEYDERRNVGGYSDGAAHRNDIVEAEKGKRQKQGMDK